MDTNQKVKRIAITIEFEDREPELVTLVGDDLDVHLIQRKEIAAVYPVGKNGPMELVATGYYGIGLMVTKEDKEQHRSFLAQPGESLIRQGDRLVWPRDWSRGEVP